MRNHFAKEITEQAGRDQRLVLLSGDIGNKLFDEFKAHHGERFFNCGVAEANMMGVAAGMAMSGLRPIAYTITPFITTRCLEQIRDDVCYPHVPVIITAVGAGLSYASLGATHHACEDIAFLRALPGMTVVCPGDALEVRAALRAALGHDGPLYLRLGKKNEPVIHADVPELEIGRSITVRSGQDACILSTGNLLPTAVQTAERLAEHKISARVESFHTVKPLDDATLEEVFERYAVVMTLEEHSVLGGFGGGVAEWRADRPNLAGRLLRAGTSDTFMHEAGAQAYAREHFGITPESLAKRIAGALDESGGKRRFEAVV